MKREWSSDERRNNTGLKWRHAFFFPQIPPFTCRHRPLEKQLPCFLIFLSSKYTHLVHPLHSFPPPSIILACINFNFRHSPGLTSSINPASLFGSPSSRFLQAFFFFFQGGLDCSFNLIPFAHVACCFVNPMAICTLACLQYICANG